MSDCLHQSAESSLSINDVCTECGAFISHVQSQTSKRKNGTKVPITKDCITKDKRGPYKPRRTPAMLREKRARTEVKVDMLAAVPGVSRAKAEAVIDACEGSMARVVGASSTEFARVVFKGAPIGMELGVAIWRAFH